MNQKKPINISVLGDGGWGTTLAVLLCRKGYPVCLWSAFADYSLYLDKKRVNSKFLPGIKIPQRIEITSDLKKAVYNKQLVIIAVPSQYLRQVLRKLKQSGLPKDCVYVSVTKGIEQNSLKRMSEVIQEELGRIKLAVLSGPTIAHEVVIGLPTTAVVAAKNKNIRNFVQDIIMTQNFRIYTSTDIIGVELGGSLKNVIAIACGIADGLKFGTNTKAALLSRGLAETARLGVRLGANAKTFSGISGLGDLVTTCISPYSRNRCVGEKLGQGKSIQEISGHMQMVAEGVPTARSAYALSKKYKIDMPITREVYLMLYKNKSPREAVKTLMARQKKDE